MRVGLSWDLDATRPAAEAWKALLNDVRTADGVGLDSAWVTERRDAPSGCPSPAHLLTFAARRTKTLQLRTAGRRVTSGNTVRLAEETAVLDLFSRGRAGVAFAPASEQGIEPDHLHEAIDMVLTAWTIPEFRYRGDHLRFPTHTAEDAPKGATVPEKTGAYVPQWERGPAMPDYLAITPKPFSSRPPVYVDIKEEETLAWAAQNGISPFVDADTPLDTVVERLRRYRDAASEAGRPRWATEAVVERRLAFEESDDQEVLAGSPADLIEGLRALGRDAGVQHLVWRRGPTHVGRSDELFRFAGEVQPLLQA